DADVQRLARAETRFPAIISSDGLCLQMKEALRVIRERNPRVLIHLFGVITFACLAANWPLFAHASSQTLSSATASHLVDANKGPSELNHHIAGWALIGVGLLLLASLLFPHCRTHRYVWPALLVL